MNNMNSNQHELSAEQREELLSALSARFEKKMQRPKGLDWAKSRQDWKPIRKNCGRSMKWKAPAANRTWSVMMPRRASSFFMIAHRKARTGRRNLCYDRQALDSRKENKPEGSALEMAAAMGIELLTETQYRELQPLGDFDLKTSSWVQTPPAIRKLGGALFATAATTMSSSITTVQIFLLRRQGLPRRAQGSEFYTHNTNYVEVANRLG